MSERIYVGYVPAKLSWFVFRQVGTAEAEIISEPVPTKAAAESLMGTMLKAHGAGGR